MGPQAQARVYMQGPGLVSPSLGHLCVPFCQSLVSRKLAHMFLPGKLAGNLNASSSCPCPWSAILPL